MNPVPSCDVFKAYQSQSYKPIPWKHIPPTNYRKEFCSAAPREPPFQEPYQLPPQQYCKPANGLNTVACQCPDKCEDAKAAPPPRCARKDPVDCPRQKCGTASEAKCPAKKPANIPIVSPCEETCGPILKTHLMPEIICSDECPAFVKREPSNRPQPIQYLMSAPNFCEFKLQGCPPTTKLPRKSSNPDYQTVNQLSYQDPRPFLCQTGLPKSTSCGKPEVSIGTKRYI